jgi:hypothetical protein
MRHISILGYFLSPGLYSKSSGIIIAF